MEQETHNRLAARTPELLQRVFEVLADHFGPRHWWPADSPFEVVIGAILTQNTAWRNVEYALAQLRAATPLSPAGLQTLGREALEERIRPAGFFRQKAERLQLFARYLLERHDGDLVGWLTGGSLAATRAELLALKGIGPETADSILLYAGNRPTFVVDAYTRRLGARLGFLAGTESYRQIRALFMDALPTDSDLFNEYHALIVEECKTYCRKLPACDDCPLRPHCPSAR